MKLIKELFVKQSDEIDIDDLIEYLQDCKKEGAEVVDFYVKGDYANIEEVSIDCYQGD